MNIKEAENLLGKYYGGESTLEEERLLREFFTGEEVPSRLEVHRSVFAFFRDEAAVTFAERSQESSMERMLERYREEVSDRVPHTAKRRLYYLSGMAAGLLILLSLVFAIRNEISRRHHRQNETVTAEYAYVQTRQALLMVSAGLNTGLDAVQHLKTLDDALDHATMFGKFYNYQNQFINPERNQ